VQNLDRLFYVENRLSGASGCGKTTLLNDIVSKANCHDMRAVKAPKYSEREGRGESNDIIHVAKGSISLADYDIPYVINDNKYGIKLKDIRDLLDAGYDPFIIVSDFRNVRWLKDSFRERAKTIYVSSAIDAEQLRRIQSERLGFRPDEEQKAVLSYHFDRLGAAARLGWWDRVSECVTELEKDWRAYATDAKSTEIRAQRIRAFHIRYIEHLQLFDYVILNYSENKPEEMTVQARNIILNGPQFEPYKKKKHPPIFIVAAASGSGKGTLMEMLNFIGSNRIKITSKVAKRLPKPEDRRDGMIPILGSKESPPIWPDWWTHKMISMAEGEQFPDEYDMRWSFHQSKDGSLATSYAVSSTEIQQNIDRGYPQIFVSNMRQFQHFRERWPNNSVFVYLHFLTSEHQNREYQIGKWKGDPTTAEIRIEERRKVHQDYLERIAEFDHVLLNTSFQEDLYDQMFRLIEHYCGPSKPLV